MQPATFCPTEVSDRHDDAWAALHRGRANRIRHALPGEAPPGSMIAARCVAGRWERLFFQATDPIPGRQASEREAAAIFDRLLNSMPVVRMMIAHSAAVALRRDPRAIADAERRHGTGRA
jgi:hypothetical protein